MDAIKVKIFLEDECPRIGCGWRYVTARVGRKWVYLRDAHGRTGKLALEAFQLFKPLVIACERERKRTGGASGPVLSIVRGSSRRLSRSPSILAQRPQKMLGR